MSFHFGASNPFNWPRYWRVWSDGHDGLISEEDSHFLPDPGSIAQSWAALGMDAPASLEPDPKPLAEVVHNKSAIVLLGRPGAGKSTELDQALKLGLFHDEGHPPIRRRGKSLILSQGPEEFIFERDDWREARERAVTLVLDGVDEIMQISPRFMEAFRDALDSELTKRGSQFPVRLVLSCRSAEWRAHGLLRAWPKERQVVAGLCHLTWAAAEGFVQSCLGEKVDAFWAEANRLQLGALVVWPHSLNELVEQFDRNAGLPRSHFDLIREASRQRCRVSSSWDGERAQRLGIEESPQWMFRLVGRVAAISVFGGQPAVSRAVWEMDNVEPWLNSALKEINAGDFDALGRSGHFDVTGDQSLIFQHQIFREHMAASWLAERHMTVHQLKRLFGQARGDGWVHYPQLATVAAWLAADPSQNEWRQFLIQHDPMVLLRSDATNLADQEKQDIAEALLERARRDGHTDPGQAHQSLDTLACDGLAAIIERFLNDTSPQGIAARELAIEMIQDARVATLVPKLWDYARAEHETQRVPIARALRELAGEECRMAWEDVLAERIPSDEHGILLGSALDLLIPKHKGVRDALHVLLPARDFRIYGEFTFDGALSRVPSNVQDEDIIPILQRSAQNHASGFDAHSSGRETILSVAFRRLASLLDKPPFMEALAGWWVQRCYSHAPGPGWKRDEDVSGVTLDELGMREQSRRRLFLSVFAAQACRGATDGGQGTTMAMRVRDFAVLPDDLPWIVQNLEARPASETSFWCWFLADAIRDAVKKPDLRPALQVAWDRYPQLRERFKEVPEGSNVFDFLSAKWREHATKLRREDASLRRRFKDIESDRAASIRYHLETAESETLRGNPNAWTTLTHAVSMSRSPSGGVVELHSVDDVMSGPGWMKESARLYLRKKPPAFPGPDTTQVSIGLCCDSTWAFYVLGGELAAVPRDLLIDWLPYVFSNMTGSGWRKPGFEIEDILTAFAPQSIGAFVEMLGHDYKTQGGMYAVRYLESFWNEHTRQPFVALLKSVPPQPQGFCKAIEFLAHHDQSAAREVVDYWLERLTLSVDDDAGRTLMAGMITALNGYRWEMVSPVLSHSYADARKVLVHAFGRLDLHHERDRRLASFSDAHLAELVEVMFRAFPPAEDPRRDGGDVTAADEARFARNTLFGLVQDRGLVDVIRRLRALELPKTERWFGNALARAKAAKNSAEWKPLAPHELFGLARQHDLALIRTNDELLDAAELAVRRYGELIKTRRLSDIWVRDSNTTQPESHISECLRTWLDSEWGVILPREAETARGKRTDIEVPLNRAGLPALHMTIEVKKTTRSNVLHGMETQLRDDYLLARGHTHGLYVVFWVGSPAASGEVSITNAGELEEYLEQQSLALSQGSLRIKAVVINCELPLTAAPKRKQRRRSLK